MSALSTLFDQLLSLPPAQHAAFLDTLEPELAAGLRELLAADAEAAALSRAGQGVPDVALVLGNEALDQRFRERRAAELSDAGFEIVRRLGRGGMGEVWLVERAVAGGRQRLALKLLQPGRNEPALLARFRSEQRILLELDHPGIARLVDAGELADGRPWLAMEYIDGPDLLTHADHACLSLKDRLKLFQQVCAAVQYAHDRLIIHRDLKPANVLVDSHGAPKLLDFGIAKILGDTGAAQLAVQTGTAQSLFSLYGVAPEQMQGQRATVATDVYALGTLLYELVCGQRAHRFEGLSFAAIERQLLHESPEPPARRLRGLLPEEQRALAAARGGASPEQLRRELGEELDRIVLHALRKAPAERYASAREFAADVQRLLDQHPVLAVGQGRGYRLRKFLKRQRWAVAGVLLAIAATIGFILRLQTERDAAITARQSAEQVSQFMVGLFKVADPESPTHDPDIKASELLVQALKRVEIEGLAKDPEVGGPLLVALAQAANGLGNLEREKEVLETARNALAGRSGPVVDELDVMEVERLVRLDMRSTEFPLLADLEQRPLVSSLRVRVVLLRDQLLVRAGQPELALKAVQRAFSELQDSTVEQTYAWRLQLAGRAVESKAILKRLLTEASETPRSYLRQAQLMRLLADCSIRLGQREEAFSWLERAIRVLEERLVPSHPRLLDLRATLGAMLANNGRPGAAIELNYQTLKMLDESTLRNEPTAWTLQSNLIRELAKVEYPDPKYIPAATGSIERIRPLGARFAQWGFATVAAVELLESQGKSQEALALLEYALAPGHGKFELSAPRRLTLEAWSGVILGNLKGAEVERLLASEIPPDSRVRSRLLKIKR